MDEAHKLEIAARIRQLREESHYGQQQVADKLGIGLRAYQKVEEVGTTRYERCEELGKIFDVEPRWIWEGERKPTPDLLGNNSDQLDRIEQGVTEILARLDLLDVQAIANEIARLLSEEPPPDEEAPPEAEDQ